MGDRNSVQVKVNRPEDKTPLAVFFKIEPLRLYFFACYQVWMD
jgi:hypothetical protein